MYLTLATLVFNTLNVPVAEARGRRVSRADFLQMSTEHLFGSLDNVSYSAPFADVPRDARAAVGLARVLNALTGWKSDWEAPVGRGEALKSLFALAKLTNEPQVAEQFRDVRSRADRRLVMQAMNWNLLEPRTPTFFGWNRALTESDLSKMLEHFGARLTLPLAIPGEETKNVRNPRARARTSTKPTRGNNMKEGTVTIKIGAAKSDSGSRSGSRVITSTSLPRNDLLEAVWGIVQSQYLHLDRVDQDELAYKLAEAVMKSLDDKYSIFMRPKNAESFQKQIQGELSGIGAQVESDSAGGVLVISPLPGSPAMDAGILPGDRITHVNGKSILEINFQDAIEEVRGPVGSTAELTIERGGGKLLISVVRDKISLPEIVVSNQDGVAIIKLVQFGTTVRQELTEVIRSVLADSPSAIILDLRNNPGGLLDAAVDVVSHFLPEDAIVARIKSSNEEHVEAVNDNSKFIVPADMPIGVLVNGGSASASEIVAGALKDHKRATIFGQKTFGKGTVQQVVSFVTGESVKLTIAEWMTPLGLSIDGAGVMPDVEIEEGERGGRDEALLQVVKLMQGR